MLPLRAALDFDAFGCLPLGADPVATAMLHAAAGQGRELDAFVVRKEGKAHGLQRRIEGPDVAGRRVVGLGGTPPTRGGGVAGGRGARGVRGKEPTYLPVSP